MATVARSLRVFINGVDVSRNVLVGGVEIKMPVDSVVTTTVTFSVVPEIVGNEIRLTLGDAPVLAGRAVPESHRRALSLSGLVAE